ASRRSPQERPAARTGRGPPDAPEIPRPTIAAPRADPSDLDQGVDGERVVEGGAGLAAEPDGAAERTVLEARLQLGHDHLVGVEEALVGRDHEGAPKRGGGAGVPGVLVEGA